MSYWLVKTEPQVYSIEDLQREKVTEWTGVRNYQARNFLKQMAVGDSVLVYHSNAEPPGVVGVASVKTLAAPDSTQFDSTSEYFDPAASMDQPRWFCPKLEFRVRLVQMVTLDALRQNRALEGLVLLQRGSRLSVVPVSEQHYRVIEKMGSL